MAKIIVKIKKDGSGVEVKTEGYSGPVCREKTRALEQKIGIVTTDVETPEIYAENTQDTSVDQH